MAWYSKALGLVTGLFSGGGGIVSAVGSGLTLADDVVKNNTQRDLEAAGAAKQRDVDDETVLKNLSAGNAAAHSDSVADLVRRRDETS